MRWSYHLLAVLFWSLLVVARVEPAESDEFPWYRVQGLKISEIKTEILAEAASVLEKVPSYGRCRESVATCLRKKSHYATASRLAKGILPLVANKVDLDQIKEWVDARKRMAHPEKKYQLNLTDLTPLGNSDAKIVVVEFSDFQCPYCAKVAPMLERVVRNSKGKARLYLKQFPLKTHPRALEASKACVASDKFGKFWEFCSRLFERRQDLSEEKLLRLAEETGFDIDKFRQEMQREETLSRIADEKMEGLRSKIDSTPAVFINGKKVITKMMTFDLLRDRIEEELDILHGRD